MDQASDDEQHGEKERGRGTVTNVDDLFTRAEFTIAARKKKEGPDVLFLLLDVETLRWQRRRRASQEGGTTSAFLHAFTLSAHRRRRAMHA